jgi:hypothetical protein
VQIDQVFFPILSGSGFWVCFCGASLAQVNFSILTGSGFSLYYSCVQFAQVHSPMLTVPGLVRFSFREMRQVICCSNRLGMWRVFLRAWNFSKSFAVLTASTTRLFCACGNRPSSFAVLVGSLFGCFRLRIWPSPICYINSTGTLSLLLLCANSPKSNLLY